MILLKAVLILSLTVEQDTSKEGCRGAPLYKEKDLPGLFSLRLLKKINANKILMQIYFISSEIRLVIANSYMIHNRNNVF